MKALAGLLLLSLALPGTVAMAQPNNLCPGDLNGDTLVTVDELVRSVGASLRGCANIDPTEFTYIHASTDKSTYQVGGTVELSMRLFTSRPKSWWAPYRLSNPYRATDPLLPCLLNFRISRGHFFVEEVLYEKIFDQEASAICILSDGGPRRVQSVVTTPPAFNLGVRVPLVEKQGEGDATPLPPGIYYLEGELLLGLIPEDSDPARAPDSPRLKAGVHVEIVEGNQ